MRTSKADYLRHITEFEVNQDRCRVDQIETMIAEFDRKCVDLGQQIEAEENRARVSDPTHFAYPTYAKAARERRAKVQQSAEALRNELARLKLAANEVTNGKFTV